MSLEDEHTVAAVSTALRSGHPVDVRLWGGSMRPWIRPGARLRFVPATPQQVKRGEVLLVERDGTLLAHRLIGRQGPWLLLRSDASVGRGPAHTERIHERSLLGRVEGLPLGERCWPLPRAIALLLQRPLLAAFPTRWLHRLERRLHAWAKRRPHGLQRLLGTAHLRMLTPEDLPQVRSWLLATGRRPDASLVTRWRERLARRTEAVWAMSSNQGHIHWLAVQDGLRDGDVSHLSLPALPWRLQGRSFERELLERALTRAASAQARELRILLPPGASESWHGALRDLRFDPSLPWKQRQVWSRRVP